MDSYFLDKYVPGESDFTYNISNKFWNIKPWVNKYLIRGYSKDLVFDKVFTLDYYDNFSNGLQIKEKECFTKNDDEYLLNITYWSYILDLWDTKVEFFNDVNRKYWKNNTTSYIKVESNWIESLLKWYSLFASTFSNPKLKRYWNWDILFSVWGHEGPLNYVYFSNKLWKFVKVFDVIEENIENPNYYSDVVVNNDEFIIKSFNTPWSDGKDMYEIRIDKNTLEIIK
jgi:hypothetical protein